jgi:HSP20 family molecular chaperone IbpA
MAFRSRGFSFSVARKLSERNRERITDRPSKVSSKVDLQGVVGVLTTLRSVVEILAKVSQTEQGHGGGASHFCLGRNNAQTEFGITMRFCEDGILRKELGKYADAEVKPQRADADQLTRRRISEVFENDDSVIVVAELPGADPLQIKYTLNGLSLLIEASGSRTYRKMLTMPVPVELESLMQGFQNGILEIRLRRHRLP